MMDKSFEMIFMLFFYTLPRDRRASDMRENKIDSASLIKIIGSVSFNS